MLFYVSFLLIFEILCVFSITVLLACFIRSSCYHLGNCYKVDPSTPGNVLAQALGFPFQKMCIFLENTLKSPGKSFQIFGKYLENTWNFIWFKWCEPCMPQNMSFSMQKPSYNSYSSQNALYEIQKKYEKSHVSTYTKNNPLIFKILD